MTCGPKRLIVGFLFVVAILPLASYALAEGETIGWSGIEVQSTPPHSSASISGPVPAKVIVSRVVEQSPAANAGVRPGDLVVFVNGDYISNLNAYNATMQSLAPGTIAQMHIVRSKDVLSVAIQLTQAPAAKGATQPEMPPLLRLETGAHMARIRTLVFTDDGQKLLSAGDDKTVRTWSVASGNLRSTFRSFQHAGPDGQINSVAVFPDQKRLAIAGYFFDPGPIDAKSTSHIRILDAATGEVLSVLRGHLDAINKVVVSNDGNLLVSGGADGTLISWDVTNALQKWKVTDPVRRIHDVVFAAGQSRVIARRSDGTLGVWSAADGQRIDSDFDRLREIESVAYCRTTGELAVADRLGKLQVYDAALGHKLRQLQSPRDSIGEMVCSPDGQSLLVTCGDRCNNDFSATMIAMSSGETISRFNGPNSRVTAAAMSPDSQLVATTGSHQREIAVWLASTGTRVNGHDGEELMFKGVGQPYFVVGIDQQADQIAWGSVDKGSHNSRDEPLEFRLQLPNKVKGLGRPEKIDGDASAFSRSQLVIDQYSLQAQRGGSPERRYGRLEIKSSKGADARIERSPVSGFEHTAYSFTSDGKLIISGGRNGVLESYDFKGDRVKQFVGHEDVVWSVATAGGRLVTGGSDQTVRLWNVETGELIVSLFHGTDGEWVMWTTQGFYAGSPAAGSLVGWQINDGIDKAGSYVRGEQYRNVLHRQDIVERAIVLGSARTAVEEAFPGGFTLAELLSLKPPSVRIGSPTADDASAFGGHFIATAFISGGASDLLGVIAYVNGQKVAPISVPVVVGHPRPPPGWLAYSYEVPLFEGTNTVELVAYNSSGSSARGEATISILHRGEGRLNKRGTLHVVAVGVDNYSELGRICGPTGNSSCNLSFAGKDAAGFLDAVSAAMGQSHSRISSTLLVDGLETSQWPTQANIMKAVTSLSESKEEDTVVIFLAGHGERDKNGRYYFLPRDARKPRGAPSGFGQNLIDWGDIQSELSKALGRRLIFVDACHAGAVNARLAYNTRLLNDAKSEEFVAFAAASANELAEENSSVGHGLFTYAIINRLQSEQLKRRTELRVYGLGDYLADEVRKLSSGRQGPEFYSGKNFVIAHPPQ